MCTFSIQKAEPASGFANVAVVWTNFVTEYRSQGHLLRGRLTPPISRLRGGQPRARPPARWLCGLLAPEQPHRGGLAMSGGDPKPGRSAVRAASSATPLRWAERLTTSGEKKGPGRETGAVGSWSGELRSGCRRQARRCAHSDSWWARLACRNWCPSSSSRPRPACR